MDVYADLEFPAASVARPYVFINMVTTIDGKSVIGGRQDDVQGLGSRIDYRLMTRIERAADAVLVGAQTLRATTPNWNPAARIRVVTSRSGQLPHDARFLTEGESYVAAGDASDIKEFGNTKVLRCGASEVDVARLLGRLRTELGVLRLVVMGGSELNAQLLRNELVDELFLTIAPKVKLGRDTPTYAGGEPFPRDELLEFSLNEHHVIGDEVFLRYRRNKH